MTILAQRDGVRIIGIRKCGHTSIINTFLTNRHEKVEPGVYRPLVRNSGDGLEEIKAYRGDLTNSHDWPAPSIELAFIRNPVHRALSAYQHFIVRGVQHDGTLMRDNFNQLGYKPGMTFAEYCDYLPSVFLDDPHTTPYSDELLKAGLPDTPYMIAPLELIDDIWPAFMEQFNIDCPRLLPTVNAGQYQADDFLTDDLVEKLRELYSEDYLLWEFLYNEARETFSTVNNQVH